MSNARWHEPNDKDPEDKIARARHLILETASIEMRQASWHQLGLWNATLFSNRELPAFRWGEPNADWELQPTDLRTENLIESIGEAFLSKAASSPLKPTLVPHGNRLETERAVRVLDNFMFGVWQQTEAEEAAIQMFLDAYISGIGCVQVGYNDKTGQLITESVFFDHLVIDNRECSARQPPRTYRIRKVLPRAVIEARYNVKLPEEKKQYVDYRSVADGWCVVVEAWRKPDDAGEGGYHMVAADGVVLDEGVWKESWVPLIFFSWTDNPSGFFGKSGVEQLVPFQNKQNDLNEAVEKTIDIVCVPRLLVNASSAIDVNQWDNEFGRMLAWSGVEPKPFEWRTNLMDLCNERERNRAGAFSHMGLSEQFTGADLPQQVRLDSSAGVREFHNMEDRRNLRRWSRFEKARMNIAKTQLKVLGTSEGAKAYSAFYHPGGTKAAAIKIPYESVRALTEDEFTWSMEATPIAAMSPAARREIIRDYTSRGLVKEGSDEARRMESNSNLEREEDMEMASKDDIDIRVIGILESGKYEAPTIATNRVYGIPRVINNYHRLKKYEDIKDTDVRLFNHLRWITSAIAMNESLAQAQQQKMTPFSPTQGMAGTNSSNGPPVMMQGAPAAA